MFAFPAVLKGRLDAPKARFQLPDVAAESELYPTAVLLVPVADGAPFQNVCKEAPPSPVFLCVESMIPPDPPFTPSLKGLASVVPI